MSRTRPNFIIPGAGKSGTNSLRSYLNEHPDIYFCRAKEPNFFAHAYDLGEEWYEGLFSGSGDAVATGEASTHYFWYPEAPRRMYAYNPDMRFVFSLRDPVRRAYSDYTAKLSRAGEAMSFREIVDADTTLLAHSRYHTNLNRYLNVFPREQIYIIVFDDFIADRNAVLAGICEFLGVDSSFKFSSVDRRENRSQMPISAPLQRFRMRFAANNHDGAPKFYAKAAIRRGIDVANHVVETRAIPPMPHDDQRYVAGLLKGEIEGLEELLQRDLSHWKTVTTEQARG
jgi:hypothetical protein